MLKPKGNSPKSISDFSSDWTDRIALLIIVGLLVEVASVFVFNKPWSEAGWTIAADGLIVIGVFGELWFAKRARAADGQRATDAELRLLKLQLPRQLDEAKFNEAIEGQPKAKVEVVFDPNTSDASGVAVQLLGLLERAGWTDVSLVALQPQRVGIGWMPLPETMMLGACPEGISVVAQQIGDSQPILKQGTAYWALWRAITAASDSPMGPYRGGDRKLPEDMLRVVIARRS